VSNPDSYSGLGTDYKPIILPAQVTDALKLAPGWGFFFY